nr:hypothetical protein [Tanacetum cinerariifolium]GEZ64673.1 hypothetical protein [Tanacetum cinerariifolium]
PNTAEGPVTQSDITHDAAYQANDLDAYDSDCDEISIAKAVLMTNFSSYVLDVLSELERYKEQVKFLEEKPNVDLGKSVCHNNIKNDLRKLKGKEIVDNTTQVPNATTISPGMYKLDPVTLAPRDKNNRETHIYYLKHIIEQDAILREIVEQASLLNPLYSVSYSAYKYVKLIQELIGVNPSTSASGSKPSGNKKNDRIPQTPSSNEKNKVEVQSRKVKSSLNKQNSDSKNACNKHVKHPVKGVKALCYI